LSRRLGKVNFDVSMQSSCSSQYFSIRGLIRARARFKSILGVMCGEMINGLAKKKLWCFYAQIYLQSVWLLRFANYMDYHLVLYMIPTQASIGVVPGKVTESEFRLTRSGKASQLDLTKNYWNTPIRTTWHRVQQSESSSWGPNTILSKDDLEFHIIFMCTPLQFPSSS